MKTVLVALALVAGCAATPSTPLQEEETSTVPIACLDALYDAEKLVENFRQANDTYLQLMESGDYFRASERMSVISDDVRDAGQSFEDNTESCRKIAQGR